MLDSDQELKATAPMQSAPTVKLELLTSASDPHKASIDVILLHLKWLAPVSDWAIVNLKSNGISIGNANVYGYEVSASVDDTFEWPHLLRKGEELCDVLLSHSASNEDEPPRPLVLVAHSLAGYALKQCMWLVHRREKCHSLKKLISGVVLMGVPHCTSDSRRGCLYKVSAYILQAHSKLNASTIARLQASSDSSLFNICEQYDEICGRFHILSMYEGKPTRVSRSVSRRRANSTELVDKTLATVDSSKHEILIPVDTDHRDIPKLGGRESPFGFVRAIEGLRGVMESAARAITSPTVSSEHRSNAPGPLIEDSDIGPSLTPFRYPTELPCFMADISRQRNPNFRFREDILIELKHRLLDGSRTVVLQGEGGLGKSEVALEFIDRHKAFFDAILWIQADELENMRRDFGKCASLLGLYDGTDAIDPFTSRELTKKWLQDPKKADGVSMAKWLIVFDGADRAGILREFASIHGKGSILITSKNLPASDIFECHLPGTVAAGFSSIDLPPLTVSEGVELLKKAAGITGHNEDTTAKRVVEQLSGNPLAIISWASIIKKDYLTLAEFCAAFQSDLEDETLKASMSMARLSEQAMALLRVCAMLDPENIQESLFAEIFTAATAPSEKMLPLKGFPCTAQEYKDARTQLLAAGLLQRNLQKQQLCTHKSLQVTVRGQCSTGVFDCAFATAANLVRECWKAPDDTVRDYLKLWEPCSEYHRHVVHLQSIYSDRPEDEKPSPCKSFAWLLKEAASLQSNLGNTPGLKNTLDLALAVCKALPKRTFSLQSDIYHLLGSWANETNHPEECMEYNKQYLDMRLQADAGGTGFSERTAYAYNQVGTAHMMLKEYPQAIEAFQRSIDLYRQMPLDPAKCPDSLPIVNLGLARWLSKDYNEALDLLHSGLLSREEAYGFMDATTFRTGRFYHALGNVRWDQGKMTDSYLYHKRALQQYKATLSSWNHRTADVCHRVAQHCLRDGPTQDLKQAKTLIDQALATWRADVDSFKPEIARTTFLKYLCSKQARRPWDAEDLLKEAAEMRRQLRPKDPREPKELTEADFDELVAFWSR